MTRWSCRRQRRVLFSLLHGDLQGAELIAAQAHLDACADCRADMQRWSRGKDALKSAPIMLSARHAQALTARIGDALAQERRRNDVPARMRVAFGVWQAAAVAAAILLVVIGSAWLRRPVPPMERLQHVSAAATPAEIVAIAPGVARALSKDVTVSASSGALLVWHSAPEGGGTLMLDAGTIDVTVDPLRAPGELVVQTAATRVRVIGTAFTVTAAAPGHGDRVRVEHGVVAVASTAWTDAELVLRAGDALDVPWGERARVSVPIALRPSGEPKRPTSDACAAKTLPAAIAADPSAAEPCVHGATEWAMLGDAFVKAKQPARAHAAYTKVYRDFPASPEAESALYYLGVLESERGEVRAADRRVQEYLRRYPKGDFVDDALWRRATHEVSKKSFTRAADLLRTLIDGSPRSARATEALFLLASICDRELDDHGCALEAYRAFSVRGDAEPRLKMKALERLGELGAEK